MIKNIRISNKLALMLVIPMLGLLYFTIGITWEKQKIVRRMVLSQELVKLTIKSSALIHELQKERGLSAGFIGSKATEFITELPKQRQITDSKIIELKLLLNNFSFKSFPVNIKRKLDQVLLELDKIKTNRILINKQEITLDIELKFYTNIIDLLLINVNYFATLVVNAKLSNQIVSYFNLLQVKEKSGIERAILNNVFGQKFFSAKMYERFISLVTIQDNYTKEFFFFASSRQKQIYHNLMNHNKDLLFKFAEIRRIIFTQEVKLQLVNKLYSQVGYGGLIHQFKNYVLRGKKNYVDDFIYKYQQTKNIFHEYKNINGVSAQDIENIKIVEETFAQYRKNLEIVIQLKQQHKLAENIDAIVKIDDNPAIKALDYLLKGGNIGIYPNQWWKLATKRIDLLRDIEHEITTNLNYSTNLLKIKAQTTFVSVLLVMLVIIFGTFFISYIFVRSITEPLKKLIKMADKISNGEREVKNNLSTRDEIGKLSTAMYNMLDSINNSELILKNTNQSYARFVPNECLNLLEKEYITEVKMGHNIETDMTILFSDIRSFTALSENMSPQENFNFINNYLKIMGPIVRKYDGIIDKYIGDAIMALFENPDSAIEAGIAMLKELNNDVSNQKIKIGIGINTGKLMFGIVGEEHRLQCTVISDAVNLASRLENATKTYGNDLIISNNTFIKLDNPKQYNMRFLDKIKVKGRSEKINIFEVFAADELQLKLDKQANIEKFEQAVNLYQEYQFITAQQLMQECLQVNSQDKTANIYIKRCQQFLKVEQNEDWEKIAETVRWTPDVAVNHPVIDAQHEELFNQIRDLIMSIGNNNTTEEVEIIINFLEEYVITHFTTEENLMQECNYIDYPEHKAAHESFKDNLRKIKIYYQKKGGSLYLTLRIKDEIVDWLVNHIKKMDQKLASLL